MCNTELTLANPGSGEHASHGNPQEWGADRVEGTCVGQEEYGEGDKHKQKSHPATLVL